MYKVIILFSYLFFLLVPRGGKINVCGESYGKCMMNYHHKKFEGLTSSHFYDGWHVKPSCVFNDLI